MLGARVRVVKPSGVVTSVQITPLASMIWSSSQPSPKVFSRWWKRHFGFRFPNQVWPPAAGLWWSYSVTWSRSLVEAGWWQPGHEQRPNSPRTTVSSSAVGR